MTGIGSPSTALAARSRPPGVAAIARARAALELRLFFREREQVIFVLLYPIVMMVIFGSVFGDQKVAGGVTFPQYFLAGIAATGIVLSSFQSLAIRIAFERGGGELARLQALGTPAIAYFAGKAVLVLVTTALQLAALLVLARYAYDVAMPVDAAHWLTFVWVTLLGSLSGTVLGVAGSLLARKDRNAPVVIAPIVIVLEFFSGVFFVFSNLPTWMQQIASVFPLRWLTLGMRSVFLPDRARSAETSGSWQHGLIALVLTVWIVLGVAVCVRWFRWRRTD